MLLAARTTSVRRPCLRSSRLCSQQDHPTRVLHSCQSALIVPQPLRVYQMLTPLFSPTERDRPLHPRRPNRHPIHISRPPDTRRRLVLPAHRRSLPGRTSRFLRIITTRQRPSKDALFHLNYLLQTRGKATPLTTQLITVSIPPDPPTNPSPVHLLLRPPRRQQPRPTIPPAKLSRRRRPLARAREARLRPLGRARA